MCPVGSLSSHENWPSGSRRIIKWVVLRRDSVDKRERKAAISYLRDLLNEWDPIGGGHVPPDEYDCLVGHLLGKLTAGAPDTQRAIPDRPSPRQDLPPAAPIS